MNTTPTRRHWSPNGPAPTFAAPDGWTATRTLSGVTEIDGPVSLRGSDEIPSGQALWVPRWPTGSACAPVIASSSGGRASSSIVSGGGQSRDRFSALAQTLVGDNGWWMISRRRVREAT